MMIKKNKIIKYNLEDIFRILVKQKIIFLYILIFQIILLTGYEVAVKEKYKIIVKFTSLDYISYKNIYLKEGINQTTDDNILINDNINILYNTPYTLFHAFAKKIEQKLLENNTLTFNWAIEATELLGYIESE